MHIVKRTARRVAGAVIAVALVSNGLHAAEPLAAGAGAPCVERGGAWADLRADRRLAAAAESHAAAADPAIALQSPPAATEAEPSRPFFKTPRGVVTGVLMAAGLSWVLYSKSHDRVRSPANQ